MIQSSLIQLWQSVSNTNHSYINVGWHFRKSSRGGFLPPSRSLDQLIYIQVSLWEIVWRAYVCLGFLFKKLWAVDMRQLLWYKRCAVCLIVIPHWQTAVSSLSTRIINWLTRRSHKHTKTKKKTFPFFERRKTTFVPFEKRKKKFPLRGVSSCLPTLAHGGKRCIYFMPTGCVRVFVTHSVLCQVRRHFKRHQAQRTNVKNPLPLKTLQSFSWSNKKLLLVLKVFFLSRRRKCDRSRLHPLLPT